MDKQEAIKILKNFHDTSALFSVRTALETVFPELKESEDELEWLKQFIQEEAYILSMDIRDDEDQFRLKMLKRSLEWLEKQGEPIDDNIITRDDEILQAISIGLTDAVENFGWSNFGGLPIKEIQEWLEKQGEKKPIEWKDSDEKYLFWALLSIQKDIATSEINGVNTKDLNECVKWLYSLKQRIGG